jgi:hypothetical protein
MAASEGHFYLGQYFLTRGETDKARDHFKKARQAKVLIYMEHKAAEFELRKLPAADEAIAAGDEPAATKPKKKASTSAKTKRPPSGETDWKSGAFGR